MPSLASVRTSNASFHPSYRPAAVFVGGTSGVGAATVRALATRLGGNVDIVISGRNRTAAETILASLPTPAGAAPVRAFVACDAQLVKNVAPAARKIESALGGKRINFLVLSTGVLNLGGRDETEEGIDRKLALSYYSRWKFIQELVPLLENAAAAGEDARVMSVLAAGKGAPINVNDLGLVKTFSTGTFMGEGSSYNDCMVESFAEAHPTVSFTHIFPGLVRTPLFYGSTASSGFAMRLAFPLLWVVGKVAGVEPEDAAEYMVYGLLQAKAGWNRRNERGEDIGKAKDVDEDVRRMVWEHTVRVTSV